MCLAANRGAAGGALTQTSAPPFTIDRLFVRGEEPQSDLGPIAVERLADKVPGIIHHAHNGATNGIARVTYVAAINPQVALTNALSSTRRDFYLRHYDVEVSTKLI